MVSGDCCTPGGDGSGSGSGSGSRKKKCCRAAAAAEEKSAPPDDGGGCCGGVGKESRASSSTGGGGCCCCGGGGDGTTATAAAAGRVPSSKEKEEEGCCSSSSSSSTTTGGGCCGGKGGGNKGGTVEGEGGSGKTGGGGGKSCCDSATKEAGGGGEAASACCGSAAPAAAAAAAAEAPGCAEKQLQRPDCCSSSSGGTRGGGCCSNGASSSDDAKEAAAPTPTAAAAAAVPQDSNGHLLCLAVLRNDGTELGALDVFDARGKSRSFSASASAVPSRRSNNSKPVKETGGGGGGGTGKMCFSTHGAANGTLDGLLSPCFDSDGLHGEPDEGCFCGVETPHLHAHLHDPVRCRDAKDDDDAGVGGGGGCGGSEKKTGGGGEEDVGFLAQLTLHPNDDDGDDDGDDNVTQSPTLSDAASSNDVDDDASVVNIPISDTLPKECNSRELSTYLQRHHGFPGGLVRWRAHRHAAASRTTTRMYKVRHDDHTDFLVHDDATDGLHLEHPCRTCGDSDLHGRFSLVHKRRWMDDGSEPPPPTSPAHGVRDVLLRPLLGGGGPANANAARRQDSREIRLHFFEAGAEPFRILSVLASPDFFVTDVDRVHAVRGALDGEQQHEHRDDDLAHVRDDGGGGGHPTAAAAAGLSRPAKEEGESPAAAASSLASKAGGAAAAAAATIVRSQFHVDKICCASEIPAIRSIVEPLEGVARVSINPTVKTVYVDHDPSVTTAGDVEAALNAERFGARITRDGGPSAAAAAAAAGVQETGGGAPPRVGRSQFFVRKICCASEVPAIDKIVTPLPGVSEVSVNTTTKTVYVDHDTDLIAAADIAEALNDQGFGAHVRKDAGHAFALLSGIPTTAFVESTFGVAKLRDEADVKALEVVLAAFPDAQVREHAVHLPTKTVRVEHNPYFLSAAGIVDLLRKEGVEASVSSDGAADGTWALSLMKEEADEVIEHHTSSVRPHVILSGLFWVISMLSYIGGNWDYLKYVGLLSVAFGIPQIALKSFRTLRRCHFDANCMMLFAALGAVALQEFTEAAAVTFLFSISEALESRATARARNALSAIVSLRPDRANVVNPITKEIVIVPAASVAVGAIVSVRTGDKIPCDGVVIEGRSTVDESSLTGESRPVQKGPKDAVSGGTINTGSMQLVVKTTATADNSAVARLIRLVEEAQANRSQTEKLVDEFAKRYTPVVVLAALCMCTIPWAWGRETGRIWTMNGLVTIVIACPCALIISTPVTYVAGLAASAQKGIIVKGGAHLEALGLVKQIAFDKTGTLTEGCFALLHLNVVEGRRTRKEVLEYLALMEAPASHPLAAALVAAASNEGVPIPKDAIVQNHSILKGEGVTAVVDGKEVHVGNASLFKRLGLYEGLPQSDIELTDDWAKCGGTVGFISIEGVGIVGAYCVADAVRPESKDVVKSLQDMGIEVTMLTGDQRPAAIGIGNQVGLQDENIKSQLLPEDKLDFIAGMVEANKKKGCNPCSSKGNVLMCGDGVNDAPALALADVSVAMGEGAALAMETSAVTLLDSDLNKLLYSVKMGRRVIRTIVENVTFSLVVKAVVMAFTFAGKSSLWAAIASDVGAMLIVTLNGMKLLPSKKKVKGLRVLTANRGETEETVKIRGPDGPIDVVATRLSSDDPSCCSAEAVAVDEPFKNENACCAGNNCCAGNSSLK